MVADKKDGILHQPVGDLLRREIKAGDLFKKELHVPEALKRDITMPEVLKRDIPVGSFLSKEIHFSRRKETIDQVTCFACRKETPGTVAHCLHCGATLEVPRPADEPEGFSPAFFRESVSLIDMDW
jgi:hypothetical protein